MKYEILKKEEGKSIINLFKDEKFYGARQLLTDINYTDGIKVKFVSASATKNSFIVQDLFDIKIGEQIYLFYPRLRWKYNGFIARILKKEIGLVEIGIYDWLWLSNWYLVSQHERSESIVGYVKLKDFNLCNPSNIIECGKFRLSWVSFIIHVFYVIWEGPILLEMFEIVQLNIRDEEAGLDEVFFGQVILIYKKKGAKRVQIRVYGIIKKIDGKFHYSFYWRKHSKMLITFLVPKQKVLFY